MVSPDEVVEFRDSRGGVFSGSLCVCSIKRRNTATHRWGSSWCRDTRRRHIIASTRAADQDKQATDEGSECASPHSLLMSAHAQVCHNLIRMERFIFALRKKNDQVNNHSHQCTIHGGPALTSIIATPELANNRGATLAATGLGTSQRPVYPLCRGAADCHQPACRIAQQGWSTRHECPTLSLALTSIG
jgi:hypothetical protein